MIEKKRNSKKKLSTVIMIIVSAAAGFWAARLTAPLPTFENPALSSNVSNETCHIEKLLKTHRLFQRCKPSTRELNFLEKGGEYFADYENPRTFNEKIGYILQNYFLKSPITSQIGNKYFAKKYVAQAVGKDHVVKLLGAWDNPSDIEWGSLPNCFVLKAARGHFGKHVILVKDKSKIDIAATTIKLEEFCKTPGMKYLKTKRIIAEEYLAPSHDSQAVIDYKFFCSYGKVLFAYCLTTDDSDTCDVDNKSFSFYSIPEWERLPITVEHHRQNLIPRPKKFSRMILLAKKLSKPFPLIRIDLYEVGNRVLVGELTEDSGGAKNVIYPLIWDFKLGEMIKVPTVEELNKLIENDKKKYPEEASVS